MGYRELFRGKGQFMDETITMTGNSGMHSGDGFYYTLTKSTAYRYAKILKEGGQILVNRFGNNKIIY